MTGIVDLKSEMYRFAHPEPPSEVNLLDSLLASNATLIRSNNDVVPVETLRGKIVGLLFISLDPSGSCRRHTHEEYLRCSILNLATAYNELSISNKGCFEIVFVAKGGCCKHSFDYYLKMMPWLALPFPDSISRDHLCNSAKIPLRGQYYLLLYDCHGQPRNGYSTRNASLWFERFGADWYPFTNEKLQELLDAEFAVNNNKSLQNLLANPTRDFVIAAANDGTHVPIASLEDKVVAIYFCNSYNIRSDFTKKLVEVYEELKRKRNPFEVVMVYVDCWPVECPMQDLKSLPWLTLPHTDSNCRMLQWIFGPSFDPDHRLIIIGPHASFINNYGVSTIENYGIEAYPFNRLCVAQRVKKSLEELRLESLLTCGDQNYVLSASGDKIAVSNLRGKTVFLLFESPTGKLVGELTEWYGEIKQMDADIAVILVPVGYGESPFDNYHLQSSWLALPYNDTRIDSLCSALEVYCWPTISVFGPDGRLLSLLSQYHFRHKGTAAYPLSGEDLVTDVYGALSFKHMWPGQYDDK